MKVNVMATDIVMPNLGFDMQQARLIEWLKQVGDPIKSGEALAVVESDKANVDLESVASGVVLELLVAAGQEALVGSPIARVGQPEELRLGGFAPPPVVNEKMATPVLEISPLARRLAEEAGIDLSTIQGSGPRGRIIKEDVEAVIRQPLPSPPQVGEGTGRVGAMDLSVVGGVRALPKVRKAAREAGVNLAQVPGTGAKGVTTMADLQAYLQASKSQPAAPVMAPVVPPAGAQVIPLSRIRQVIAKRMVESKQAAPHFYVTGEFDLHYALQWLQGQPEPRPSINDLLQYLVVQSLRRVPALNATYQDQTIYQYAAINLAIAVAREEGLITPVLQDAARFSLTGLAQESRQLIERARTNKLHADDLQGGTFTISNLGLIRQVEQFVAIINPPQVAILAVGAVKPRPVVIDGGLHVRPTVHLTLSGDHRAVDGMHLAQFMAAFQEALDHVRE
jgi:pyruvate dehydrogenase E2 component (dihydrolipoamide acetyltransferase)